MSIQRIAGLALFLVTACAARAMAQTPVTLPAPRPTGRMSFFANISHLTTPDGQRDSAEFVTTVTYALADRGRDGVEYGLDFRQAQRASGPRASRLSLFDGYVGARMAGGRVRVRAGQMWLADLGALGNVAGGLVEVRRDVGRGPIRFGAFGGLDPDAYNFSYPSTRRKFGGYAILEGGGGRRHVAGYVRSSQGGVVERSVISVTNFLPVHQRLFVYQAAEYDLSGPGGQGHGGLGYFFLNVRATVAPRVEVQGLFNRGRSVDARTIVDDLLNGRPVPVSALDGLLYSSMGARVTVSATRTVRAHAGFTRDRNNRDSEPTSRLTFGGSAQDILGSGVDVTATLTRVDRPAGQYRSWYVSTGRQIGRTTYVSVEYVSAVSIVRYTRLDGFTVEMQPSSHQVGASAVVALNRWFSGYATGTRTIDEDSAELRIVAGVSLRLR
jgi:hypothetical protein